MSTETIVRLQESIPDEARDIRLNLGSVLTPEGSPGLTASQVAGTALAAAYATRQAEVVRALQEHASAVLNTDEMRAARSAAAIMAMTNIYYRFTHLVNDPDYSQMPARLRMSVIGSPGIERIDFELYCLGVSTVNGCGYCVESHARKVVAGGVPKEGVQSVARIAAVVTAAAQAVQISQEGGQ
ncbi:MAG: Alkyl hydroperoxide reductase AhpD [Candidatus Omnitrophica bacterium]|nr:Alkyl hydroperoxide reductase AhpD [Candidatus Omnitrophota bacterium]